MKSFEKLVKQLQKHYASPGHFSTTIKRALRKVYNVVIEAYSDKEQRRRLSTTSSKALTALNQRVSKYLKSVSVSTNGGTSEDSDSDDVGAEAVSVEVGSEMNKTDKNHLLCVDKKDITFEMIDDKLRDIIASRGKKSTDRQVVVKHLSYMATLAKCPAQEVEILLHIISAQFDMTGSMSSFMPITLWRSCVANILRLLQLLNSNKHISLIERGEPAARPEKDELLNGAPIQLAGSLCAFAERLDDEYTKSLQNIDPHTKEYISRLQDECFLLILIQEIAQYYVCRDDPEKRVTLSLRLLGHLHCKTDAWYTAVKRFALQQLTDAHSKGDVFSARSDSKIFNFETFIASDITETLLADVSAWFPRGHTFPEGSLNDTVSHLAELIYTVGDQRSKVRSILYDSFHKSVCGDFRAAREQLLMAHLQDSVHHMDIGTQVLFNRCMAQIGLDAFQSGSFDTAKNCLTELLGSGKVRELLAQGFSPGRHVSERNFEQEKWERRRQAPFHTHLNVDLLEAIYLVSSMLTDTHSVFNNSGQPRTLNRVYLRLIEGFERQTFTGPAEGVRDIIMCAAKHLIEGDWDSASKYVLNMSCWQLLPGSTRSDILDNVKIELKREALRTYVFQRAAHYKSLCLNTLSSMFDIPLISVQAIVNKLLAQGLAGLCDAPTCSFAVHLTELSSLQNSVSIVSEKLNVFLDANERSLGIRQNTENNTDEDDLSFKQRGQRGNRFEDRNDEPSKQRTSARPWNERHSSKSAAVDMSRVLRSRKEDNRDRTIRAEFTNRPGGRFTR